MHRLLDTAARMNSGPAVVPMAHIQCRSTGHLALPLGWAEPTHRSQLTSLQDERRARRNFAPADVDGVAGADCEGYAGGSRPGFSFQSARLAVPAAFDSQDALLQIDVLPAEGFELPQA